MSKAERLAQDGFYNVAMAAKFLCLSKQSIYNLINSNTISHARIRGVHVIPIAALREYAAIRITVGRVA